MLLVRICCELEEQPYRNGVEKLYFTQIDHDVQESPIEQLEQLAAKLRARREVKLAHRLQMNRFAVGNDANLKRQPRRQRRRPGLPVEPSSVTDRYGFIVPDCLA